MTKPGTADIAIPVDDLLLPAILSAPAEPSGVVIFAHGSGSSRLSPRNQHVARFLNESGFATLLFDLLTPTEAEIRGNVFDIPKLAHRLSQVTHWLVRSTVLDLPVGYFGASTGAAAALRAAAVTPEVRAVVSRGGRPDLAGPALSLVAAPTLLIVGAADPVVLDLNRKALADLGGEAELVVIPHAGHLFEEPGALDQVAVLAKDWFARYLPSTR